MIECGSPEPLKLRALARDLVGGNSMLEFHWVKFLYIYLSSPIHFTNSHSAPGSVAAGFDVYGIFMLSQVSHVV